MELALDDFYVYPGNDGEWTFIGIYHGEAELEGDMYQYHRDWEDEGPGVRTVLKYPGVTVQVELTISGFELRSWDIIETDADGW